MEKEHHYTLKLIGKMKENLHNFPSLETNVNYANIMESFVAKSKYYANLYYNKLVIAMKTNTLDDYAKFIQSERDKFNSFGEKLSFLK